jgi:hypothetical protein
VTRQDVGRDSWIAYQRAGSAPGFRSVAIICRCRPPK